VSFSVEKLRQIFEKMTVAICSAVLYAGVKTDFQGAKNDDVLASFFKEFEGDKEPNGQFTKVIAINEGKLRDFILFKPEYKWLGKQIHHYLIYEGYAPHESLIFVNLNSRSVVEPEDSSSSILDKLLDRLLDTSNSAGFWTHCLPQNCAWADRCYIKYNVDSLRDAKKGPIIRQRLKRLILAVHFRKTRHITMRDLRSILSYVLSTSPRASSYRTICRLAIQP
jgi:eukaryotic-like serine/threonine-protein kinase